MAEGVDGAAVDHKRHTILEFSGTDPAVKTENDLLEMLYCRHVEFAVGHGIGVPVELTTESQRTPRKDNIESSDFLGTLCDSVVSSDCAVQVRMKIVLPVVRHQDRPRQAHQAPHQKIRASIRCVVPQAKMNAPNSRKIVRNRMSLRRRTK